MEVCSRIRDRPVEERPDAFLHIRDRPDGCFEARAVAQSNQRRADEPAISYHRVLLHADELLRKHGKHDVMSPSKDGSHETAIIGDFRIARTTWRYHGRKHAQVTITLLNPNPDVGTEAETRSYRQRSVSIEACPLHGETLVYANLDPNWKAEDGKVTLQCARHGRWRERFVALA